MKWENHSLIRTWPALYWESSGLWNGIIALTQACTHTEKATETFSVHPLCILCYNYLTQEVTLAYTEMETAGDVNACGNFQFVTFFGFFTHFLLIVSLKHYCSSQLWAITAFLTVLIVFHNLSVHLSHFYPTALQKRALSSTQQWLRLNSEKSEKA